ncbi:TPA: hypothetical protein DDZ86_03740 [Candidatus Dependentiae bacterium]|nr:MAG: hypothetical protein UW09_C0003G0102 [candidate division TM6 bacterium GW2011_GWF2_43_87]HBL98728.1 hypothetical protein [Candidatus Dependentiae bacterium]
MYKRVKFIALVCFAGFLGSANMTAMLSIKASGQKEKIPAPLSELEEKLLRFEREIENKPFVVPSPSIFNSPQVVLCTQFVKKMTLPKPIEDSLKIIKECLPAENLSNKNMKKLLLDGTLEKNMGKCLEELKIDSPEISRTLKRMKSHKIKLKKLNKTEDFAYMVKEHNFEEAKAILTHTKIDTSLMNALFETFCDGDLEAIKFLVDYIPDIDTPGTLGRTGFEEACLIGSFDIADFLLSKNASLNNCNKKGMTPVQTAVYRGNIKMLEYLSGKGANLNVLDKNNGTLLHLVCSSCEANIFKLNHNNDFAYLACLMHLLIKSGLDINAVDKNKRTPFFFACQNKSEPSTFLVRYLVVLKKININVLNKNNGLAPLHEAALAGSARDILVLLENAASIDIPSDKNQTPLHFACLSGSLEAVKCLIEKGAYINNVDFKGRTPLSIAKSKDYKEIEKYLEGKGAVLSNKLDSLDKCIKKIGKINENEKSNKSKPLFKENSEEFEPEHPFPIEEKIIEEKKEKNEDFLFNKHELKGKALLLNAPTLETDTYLIMAREWGAKTSVLVLQKQKGVSQTKDLSPNHLTLLSQKEDKFHKHVRPLFQNSMLLNHGRSLLYSSNKLSPEIKSIIKKYGIKTNKLPDPCRIVWFPGCLFTGNSAITHFAELKKFFTGVNSGDDAKIEKYLEDVKQAQKNESCKKACFGAGIGILVFDEISDETLVTHSFFHREI